jgi:tetratricopeptide (TPR) repeat protein/tRNA A-37 threonylcarbamoyl transferase component Bud32
MADLQGPLQSALGSGYRIERELGGGGMSRVFLAEEVALKRRVVIKVLPPELAAAINVERFRREIQLAASLQHPHIVPLLTAGESGGLLYFTMPFIEGETLRARLEREGRLPVAAVTRIARDVADALAYAHRRGIAHRDIKPENVLLSDDHALVTDFGVAKALSRATGAATLTAVGVTLGTPVYMAPEQAAADPAADHRTDLYAVGVLAYEMLGGRPPFVGSSPQQVLAAQITEAPEPITRLRSDLPPSLAATVMRCLEKEPSARWQSAGELKAGLDGVATPAALPAAARSRRLRVASAAVLVLALAAVAIVVARSRRSTVRASPSLVAVLPFSVRGSPDIAYLGEGMVNLLSTSLDGAGDLRTVDPRAVLSMARQVGATAPDPASGAAVAERLGAGRFILGDVVEAGGRMQITAALYGRARTRTPLATGAVEGDGVQVFSLVDQLAARLLAASSGGPAARVTRIAAVTTASLPALKAYLDGEAAFGQGRMDSAVVAFQQAVAIDTSFALAYYRLSVAAEWAIRPALASEAAEQAVRHSAHLADHDRLLLQALQTTRRGAGAEAARQYRGILATYPDDFEAWVQLAEVLFHFGPILGHPPGESRPEWEKVLYLDPAYASALVHLARIAALERRPNEVDSLVSRILRLSPQGDRDLEMRVLRAYALGDRDQERRLTTELSGAPDLTLTTPVWDVAVYVGDLDGAATLARLLTEPSRSAEAQAVGHLNVAYLEMAQGKLKAARAEIARAAASDSVLALEFGTFLELAPFLEPPASTLESARAALERLHPAAVRPSSEPAAFFSAHNGVHGILRAYLLGLLSSRLGEAPAAARFAAMLETEAAPATSPGLAHDLGLEIRAEIARRDGDSAQALALLGQRGIEAWYELYLASPFMTEARGRYLEAELAARAGEAQRAMSEFGTFDGFWTYDLMFAGPSHLERAKLAERLGDRRAAAEHYRQFLALWKGADPEFKPMLDSARAGLARVAGAGGRS